MMSIVKVDDVVFVWFCLFDLVVMCVFFIDFGMVEVELDV